MASPKTAVRLDLCQIDGNAVAILIAADRALRRAGLSHLAAEFRKEATSGDYDHLLATVHAYFIVPLPRAAEEMMGWPLPTGEHSLGRTEHGLCLQHKADRTKAFPPPLREAAPTLSAVHAHLPYVGQLSRRFHPPGSASPGRVEVELPGGIEVHFRPDPQGGAPHYEVLGLADPGLGRLPVNWRPYLGWLYGELLLASSKEEN